MPRLHSLLCAGILLRLLAAPLAAAESPNVNPYPPEIISGEKLREWTFDTDSQGWRAVHDCRLSAAAGMLKVVSTGKDPYLAAGAKAPGPLLLVTMRARCATTGGGQFFWTTDRHRQTSQARSRRFKLTHDGRWREYSVILEIDGELTSLRFDPGSGEGKVDIDWIRLSRARRYPLVIERLESDPAGVDLRLRNLGAEAVAFTLSAGAQQGAKREIAGGQSLDLSLEAPGTAPFEAVTVQIAPEGFSPLERNVVIMRPEGKASFVELRGEGVKVLAAKDGSGAWIEQGGRRVAALAPLVLRGGSIPRLELGERSSRSVSFRGDGLEAAIALEGDDISVKIRSSGEVDGPVLRAEGRLEQGLFAGLEYLGKGERSSSRLDIETGEHLRWAPDPLKVTLPLMSCVTELTAAALTWKDMSLKPLFASPNFIDGAADHRMALRGTKIDATVLVREASLQETILWAVRRFGGLPPLPQAPRSDKEQAALCLAALRGPIAGAGGWGHCAEPRYTRRYFADVASTIWRLTGKLPEAGPLVPGGAHVPNDAAYFVSGNARRWLAQRRAEVRSYIASQRPDGSFRYSGRYRRGHFEDTASGFCAHPARRLLEFAWLTGDAGALAAGIKTLEYMKRFRTPRGAQTWELSLHTPDVLASAYLVWAYVRGYQLTGRDEYLNLARKWAISGVPFVYLWSRYPTMLYATPPVYGATNYRQPLWIGLPVQWCGGVYAYALTLLAPHDKTLDWRRLARGILVAGQQMQYPGGPLAGCLPDVFSIPAQERSGPSINPCALVSLELALDGKVDSLSVATGRGHRVAAPFPVRIEGRTAHVNARWGVRYQVLVDGQRVVDIVSEGRDVLPLK